MGRKKQVKSEDQKASSSSTKNKRMVAKVNDAQPEVGDGPAEKKLKEETNDVTEEQVEIKKSFDDLPPEMLMKILQKLDDPDLFRYRVVNRQWNGVASKILQTNAVAEIKFEYVKFKNEMRIKGKNQISFKSLIKCFKDSPNFPYSRLRFMQVQHSFFQKGDWLKLVANHGGRIKCLMLGLNVIWKDDVVQMTKELRNLLLQQLPNLQQLGVIFSSFAPSEQIKLFPPTSSNSEIIRLPHLKILYLDESSFTDQRDFVTDILQAAVNLQKLELFRGWRGRHEPIKNFQFLNSLGKLHLLQCASIEVTTQLLSSVKEKCTTFPIFKLKELELHWTHITAVDLPETAVFLSNLFESCKDTLTKLTMPPLDFLDELQLPTFSKLTSLSISKEREVNLLPVGLNFEESFPVLKFLEVNLPWDTAFDNFGDLHSLPSLATLHVPAERLNENSIAQINSMCPNLKNVEILYGALTNFPEVGQAIWTHLTKLQSLELRINVSSLFNNDQAIDSCITGISKEECKRLHHLINAEKSLELAGSKGKIPDSEWEIGRENVSILNLKDLKSFSVHLMSQSSDKSQLEMSMTCISEKYALKLMDNLNYSIQRR